MAASIIYLFFAKRPIVFDEIGLHNPIYVHLHSGRMTYPVHGHFDDMVVHPPTHYLVIAWLMRLGLSLFHAAAILPCALFLTVCILLLRSSYSLSLKLGLLAGVFLGALVWNQTYTVRPDLDQVLSWITGLIALECSRQADWEPKRLFLGSLLLAFASAVHYPGFLAGTSILFYVAWAWKAEPRGRALRITALAAAGAAIVAVPYFFLFVIPFHSQIADMVRAHETASGVSGVLEIHRQAYLFWRDTHPLFVLARPLTETLLRPLWASLIPAAFIGPALLAINRRTRAMAVACLPLVLFIAVGARHKMYQYTGYFAPEVTIYLLGAFAAGASLVDWLAGRFRWRFAPAWVWIPALVFCAAVLHEHPAAWDGPLQLRWDADDLDLARAATREIVRPGAFVGFSNGGVWYTSGAGTAYLIDRDIQQHSSIAGLDLKAYFGRFDAVVAGPNQSWLTMNKERVTVTSEFANGDLKLRGFYFGDRGRTTESELSLVVLGAQANDPVRGFADDGRQVYEFRESIGGDWVYYGGICPNTAIGDATHYPFFLTLFLPGPRAGERRPDTLIRTLLVPRRQFDAEVIPQSRGCQVLRQVAGSLSPVSRRSLLDGLRHEPPIKFYRNLPEALAMAGHARPENMASTPVNPARWKGVGFENQFALRGETVRFLTTARQWEDAAYLQLAPELLQGGEYLYVEADIGKGRIGVSLQRSSGEFLLDDEAFWGDADGATAIALPLNVLGADRVVIRGAVAGAPGEIVIKRVALLRRQQLHERAQ